MMKKLTKTQKAELVMSAIISVVAVIFYMLVSLKILGYYTEKGIGLSPIRFTICGFMYWCCVLWVFYRNYKKIVYGGHKHKE